MIGLIKHKIILLVLLIGIIAFFPAQGFAETSPHPSTTILSSNQTVNHVYFATGENVIIAGTVNGDAYVAGGNVDIEGTINGDLLVAGGQVNINGTVAQDVRAAGGNVHISGKVGRNVTVAGGTIDVGNSATIAGSLIATGGNISLFGPIGKDVYVSGGNAEIADTVGGNANVHVGTLVLSPKAIIAKNLTYTSPEKARMASGAMVKGNTVYTAAPHNTQPAKESLSFLLGAYITFKVITFIASLVIGLLLIRFSPVYTSRVADYVQKDFWKSVGVGFLTLVLASILIIILFFIILGIPIALLIIASLFIITYFAKIFAEIVIGRWIAQLFNKKYGLYVVFIIGAVIYFILSFISLVNLILWLVVTFVGVGAIMLEGINSYKNLRNKKMI